MMMQIQWHRRVYLSQFQDNPQTAILYWRIGKFMMVFVKFLDSSEIYKNNVQQK